MSHARLVPLGFLLTALVFVALPLASGFMAYRIPVDAALHDTYYFVPRVHFLLFPPAASVLFAAVYWAWAGLGGFVFRPVLLWAHLGLWALGAAILLTAYLMTFVSLTDNTPYSSGIGSDMESPSFWSNEMAKLHTVHLAGYCVTLLSLAVFAICIGEAILRRIRRGKSI